MRSEPLTAETITEAEIRELRTESQIALNAAQVALENKGVSSRKGMRARALCAEIINARTAVSK